MNKRQAKKKQRKEELFTVGFCNSYREARKLDRGYHNWLIMFEQKRKRMMLKDGQAEETDFLFW